MLISLCLVFKLKLYDYVNKFRTSDLTPKSRSKLKNKPSLSSLQDDGGSNERQEEIYKRMMQERDNSKVLFKNLLF